MKGRDYYWTPSSCLDCEISMGYRLSVEDIDQRAVVIIHGEKPTEAIGIFPNSNYQYNPMELWEWLLNAHVYEERLNA